MDDYSCMEDRGLAAANYLPRFAATVCIALAVSIGAASWVVFFWFWQ
ncbi:MAG: hypothetical protein WA624_08175 [Methylocella sp.]